MTTTGYNVYYENSILKDLIIYNLQIRCNNMSKIRRISEGKKLSRNFDKIFVIK